MKKNNIKTKTKVLTAGGVAIIGVGAITTGIAIGMRPQTHNPYNYT
jgi:hypothetical protein